MGRKVLIGILIAVMIGCSKTDSDMPVIEYDYFPITSGHFVAYSVTEIEYNDFTQTVDTAIYELKEQIDSSFVDGEGRIQYKLKRYTRMNDTLPWELKDVWSVFRDERHAERTEENQVFVKLSFPLDLGKTWDGNARNSLDREDYTVLNYNLKYQFTTKVIGVPNAGEIVRVNQRNSVNLIEEIFSEEVYARNIGLVEKHDINLRKNQNGEIVEGYKKTFLIDTTGIE